MCRSTPILLLTNTPPILYHHSPGYLPIIFQIQCVIRVSQHPPRSPSQTTALVVHLSPPPPPTIKKGKREGEKKKTQEKKKTKQQETKTKSKKYKNKI